MTHHIDINTSTSYGAVALLKGIMSIPGVNATKARIQTNGNIPSTETDSKNWGLIIECKFENADAREFEIRICMVTSGYGGEGPHDLVRCLKVAGFSNIDEEEIFSVAALKREYVK